MISGLAYTISTGTPDAKMGAAMVFWKCKGELVLQEAQEAEDMRVCHNRVAGSGDMRRCFLPSISFCHLNVFQLEIGQAVPFKMHEIRSHKLYYSTYKHIFQIYNIFIIMNTWFAEAEYSKTSIVSTVTYTAMLKVKMPRTAADGGSRPWNGC